MLRCQVKDDDNGPMRLHVEKMSEFWSQWCHDDPDVTCGLWCPLCVPERAAVTTIPDGPTHVTLYCGCQPVVYELVGEEAPK